MKTVEIKCDSCGKDLTTTSNCDDFRLCVSSERIYSRGDILTAMEFTRPLDASLHFCGWPCFNKFFDIPPSK